MTRLQALIKLRGVPITDIAKEQRVGYHSLQKTIKGVRKHPAVLQVLARHLGLPPHALLRPEDANITLTRLVEREIEARAEERRQELRRLYLGC